MRHEQTAYLKRVICSALGRDKLQEGYAADFAILSTIDNFDNNGIVDVVTVTEQLTACRDDINKALQAIADEQQAQNRLHNDHFINRATGERY
jgi:hypothetical protein